MLALVYQFVAFRSLLFGQGETIPVDFRLRWIESKLLMDGKDSHTWGHPDGEFPPRLQAQQTLGGGYPPWATAVGLVVAPPVPWIFARTWFALLNVAALAIVTIWAHSLGSKHGATFGWFLAAAALACAPAAICISYGQYAVLITAALVTAIIAFEKNRQSSAGLALGFCLVKPQLAAMVAVTALLRWKYRSVFIASLVVLTASAVMWIMTGIDPVTALKDSQEDAKKFSFLSINPLTEWLLPLLGFERTTLSLGLSMLAIGSLVAWRAPSQVRMSVLIAISVIISMFWSYRRGYDCPLMIIPMVLLFEAAAARRSIYLAIPAILFGVSLWLPIRNEQWSWLAVQLFQMTVWVSGGVLLLINDFQNESVAKSESQAKNSLAGAAA
jgi:hypothetical protein